jgi:hypothetical protein
VARSTWRTSHSAMPPRTPRSSCRVLKVNSLPFVRAEQRLLDAGWTQQGATTLTGSDTDLRVERWTR